MLLLNAVVKHSVPALSLLKGLGLSPVFMNGIVAFSSSLGLAPCLQMQPHTSEYLSLKGTSHLLSVDWSK